jgi:NADPH-dependent 2,4-dienoyl-CoA reductase/sulfur reductase-like enzyme
MNSIKIFTLICSTILTNCAFAQPPIEVDVCIYGGTAAGVIAAYTAQKQGKTAILIEENIWEE